jgi:hypothetical protein
MVTEKQLIPHVKPGLILDIAITKILFEPYIPFPGIKYLLNGLSNFLI